MTPQELAEMKAALEKAGYSLRKKPVRVSEPSVKQVLAKSRWYKPPRLSALAKGVRSTAQGMSNYAFKLLKEDPARQKKYGIHFPYKDHSSA